MLLPDSHEGAVRLKTRGGATVSYANVRQPNFTQPRQLRKALNSLIGLLDGVLIDGVVNQAEQLFLAAWLEQYEDKIHLHPFPG